MPDSTNDEHLELAHLKDFRAVLRWSYDHGLLKGEFPDSDSADKKYVLDEGERKLMQLIHQHTEQAKKQGFYMGCGVGGIHESNVAATCTHCPIYE